MTWFLIGLIGFLGLHSLRIVAPGWREARIAAMGEKPWKGVYSLLSIGFFVLMLWGYAQTRHTPMLIWQPPMALRHVGHLLMVIAFILLAAAYVPNNGIKSRLKHPMLAGTKTWAFAHLLMSGWLHAMILSGAFLLWTVAAFASARHRPDQPVVVAKLPMTTLTIVLGIVAAVVFALYLHLPLIGVAPIVLPR